ncbi:MAG TPA: GNAT family N-acetyltransferase [Candidatus Thermoplasmatota archaeon]|nr:GNAT family N-acetyltransferase [Candidatus Thermoplasmatota archaeon]
MATSNVLLRGLTTADVPAIQRIDALNTKDRGQRQGTELWSLMAETTTSFGAEVDGKLAGFVLADVRPWEFGARESVGWIIAIGVDPAYKGRGIGRLLGERVVQQFRKLGVRHFSTLVEESDTQLLGYFKTLGFKESPRVVLEMSVPGSPPPAHDA